LGIDPEYFLEYMSPVAFVAAHNAWDSSVRKDSWEQARLVAYRTALPYMKTPVSIEQFYPLRWDKQKVSTAPPITMEERKRRAEKAKKILQHGRQKL
jgi:hypothetical protein